MQTLDGSECVEAKAECRVAAKICSPCIGVVRTAIAESIKKWLDRSDYFRCDFQLSRDSLMNFSFFWNALRPLARILNFLPAFVDLTEQ